MEKLSKTVTLPPVRKHAVYTSIRIAKLISTKRTCNWDFTTRLPSPKLYTHLADPPEACLLVRGEDRVLYQATPHHQRDIDSEKQATITQDEVNQVKPCLYLLNVADTAIHAECTVDRWGWAQGRDIDHDHEHILYTVWIQMFVACIIHKCPLPEDFVILFSQSPCIYACRFGEWHLCTQEIKIYIWLRCHYMICLATAWHFSVPLLKACLHSIYASAFDHGYSYASHLHKFLYTRVVLSWSAQARGKATLCKTALALLLVVYSMIYLLVLVSSFCRHTLLQLSNPFSDFLNTW